ncbi:MAG: isochorismate synthase [Rothia sp. (in: high G+C Gram-positive bacteria)]|nr:isochorismate synthase [Rothia sp. (in: high G+C Gram-positive bacteria)]
MPSSANLAHFTLAQGNTVVRALGTLTPVDEHRALAVAAAQKSAVVGLLPFDPAQPAYLMVPEQLMREEHELPQETSQSAASLVKGVDNPGYRAAVARAVEMMNRGQLDKVVLARLLNIEFSADLNLTGLVDTLRAQQPRATVFSVQLPGGDYLMGASPELVFRSDAAGFATGPLAGSAARTAPIGSTEDAQIGEALMKSAKDRAEHATVVNDIRQRLAPLTEELSIPAVPSLKSTPQLWHLGTDITGRLTPGLTSLDGARAIHPTPAICGTPTEAARQLIGQLEPFERGFFGGLVGYMDAEGRGQWHLVLRCARVSKRRAVLFAGAGIVKDSVPASEHAETATKFSTFARALGVSLN